MESSAPTARSDVEEVPLTEQDKSHIAEGWLGQIYALPPGSEPDLATVLGIGMFGTIVNQVLLVHGFERGSARFDWREDGQLILMARRLRPVRVTESPAK